MSPGTGGTGWDSGSLPLPGGVPYLARRGWRVTSSAHQRCWWPHTRTCPGLSPRCSQSEGHLRGQGWDLAMTASSRMGLDLTRTPTPSHLHCPLTKKEPWGTAQRGAQMLPLLVCWPQPLWAHRPVQTCGRNSEPRIPGSAGRDSPSSGVNADSCQVSAWGSHHTDPTSQTQEEHGDLNVALHVGVRTQVPHARS